MKLKTIHKDEPVTLVTMLAPLAGLLVVFHVLAPAQAAALLAVLVPLAGQWARRQVHTGSSVYVAKMVAYDAGKEAGRQAQLAERVSVVKVPPRAKKAGAKK